MKILVCGGRDYTDKNTLFLVLDKLDEEFCVSEVIEGGAKGADTLAGQWAKARKKALRVFMADWGTHGKRAGYVRNSQMLTEGKPDMVVAFDGGRGTAMMMDMTRKAAIKLIIARDYLEDDEDVKF